MKKLRYTLNIPDCKPAPHEIAKQMRLNADIVMKEITDHVDKEIVRFKKGINEKNDP
jgi:hypothetical protein